MQATALNDKQRLELAESLDAKPELLPFVPELLADIWALGSDPELIVELLRPLGLPRGAARVLDLGCGKGAVAITLAKRLGFQVRGYDLFEPFVAEAERRAAEADVSALARFEVADMRDVLRDAKDYDVIVVAAVGGVLGSFDRCVGALRQAVRPGGYMVIDDGFLAGTAKMEQAGYAHYASRDETLRQLAAHGDRLLREIVVSPERMRAGNRRNTELIRRRADRLAHVHPDLAPLFDWYVAQQEEDSEILETETVDALWLLQRV